MCKERPPLKQPDCAHDRAGHGRQVHNPTSASICGPSLCLICTARSAGISFPGRSCRKLGIDRVHRAFRLLCFCSYCFTDSDPIPTSFLPGFQLAGGDVPLLIRRQVAVRVLTLTLLLFLAFRLAKLCALLVNNNRGYRRSPIAVARLFKLILQLLISRSGLGLGPAPHRFLLLVGLCTSFATAELPRLSMRSRSRCHYNRTGGCGESDKCI